MQSFLGYGVVICLLMLLPLHGLADGPADGGRPGIPDISYPDLNGKPQNLQDWRGKVVLLNFWASWCAPCLAEIRHLVRFQKQHHDAGLQVVGVGLDNPQKMANVGRSLEINYPLLHVEEHDSRAVLKSWGNRTGIIPYSVIFNRQGELVQAYRGILDDDQFEALIQPLLVQSGE